MDNQIEIWKRYATDRLLASTWFLKIINTKNLDEIISRVLDEIDNLYFHYPLFETYKDIISHNYTIKNLTYGRFDLLANKYNEDINDIHLPIDDNFLFRVIRNVSDYSVFFYSNFFDYLNQRPQLLHKEFYNKNFIKLLFYNDLLNLLISYSNEPYEYIIELTSINPGHRNAILRNDAILIGSNYIPYYINSFISSIRIFISNTSIDLEINFDESEINVMRSIDLSHVKYYDNQMIFENLDVRLAYIFKTFLLEIYNRDINTSIKRGYITPTITNELFSFLFQILTNKELTDENFLKSIITEEFNTLDLSKDINIDDLNFIKSILMQDINLIPLIIDTMFEFPSLHYVLHEYLNIYLLKVDNSKIVDTKKIYYTLALLIFENPELTEKEIVLLYLFYADDYADAPRLRTRLAFEYAYLTYTPDYNLELNAESVIQFLNIIRNQRL